MKIQKKTEFANTALTFTLPSLLYQLPCYDFNCNVNRIALFSATQYHNYFRKTSTPEASQLGSSDSQKSHRLTH